MYDLEEIDLDVLAEATRILMAGEGPNTITTEPELTRAQFGHDYQTEGWLLGHWSVERGDPNADQQRRQDEFAEHEKTCALCKYFEGLESLRDTFQYENCQVCGGDAADHDYGPDAFGHAHAWCRTDGE